MHDEHEEEAHEANPWPDRINEAYFDKMGASFGRQTRDRINWMCSQARGTTVLDVGCSQGIVTILLAREGMSVTGIDISPAVIDYARTEQSKEIESVRDRIEFNCSELASLSDKKFDTVVMGEVIEHQTNAERFVRKAAELVEAGGRIIITVPFGLHPWPDHKSTVFPADLVAGLGNKFDVATLDVVDGYIRVVADRLDPVKPPAAMPVSGAGVVTATQEGALQAQRKFHETNAQVQSVGREKVALEQRIVALQEDHRVLQDAHGRIEGELALARSHCEVAQSSLANYESQRHASGSYEALLDRVLKLTQQVGAHQSSSERLSSRVLELESANHSLEALAEDLRARVESLLAVESRLTAEVEVAADAKKVSGAKIELLQIQLLEKSQALASAERVAEDIRQKLRAAHEELAVAQHKRAGHYAHLEVERKKTKALTDLATELHHKNQLYQNSAALALGRSILGLRSVRGVAGFPANIVRTWQAYRQRETGRVVQEPLVLPEIRPANLPELCPPAAGVHRNVATTAKMDARTSSAPVEGVNELSVRGWDQVTKPGVIPVMSVLDEFSRLCFAPQANLIEPRPDNWKGLLDEYRPKFLFVESSWKGNYGSWQYRVANYAHPPGNELVEMVQGFRARGIPTIFWNKEDPVHFSNFIENASKFDIVLTTAQEALPKYQERTAARVGVLQFAAEESLHNPIGSAQRNGRICFAGSFYANRFHERRDDQLMLLEAASAFDFDIFDRNYQSNPTIRSDFAFPERFAPFVRGRLPYDAIGKAYREYRVFLNVNSVIDSPTMFSRRVFELLACGTPVVSTWSRGTEETFGSDLVWHVRNREEAEEAMRVLMTDDREWRRRSIAGIRAVLTAHTYRHRFAQVCQMAGMDSQRPDLFTEVLAVAEVATSAEAFAVLDSFRRQVMAADTSKRLLLACRSDIDVSEADVDVVRVGDGGLRDLIERTRHAGRQRMLATISPFGIYGRHYLQDLLHAARYSCAGLVGKPKDGLESSQYTYGAALDPRALLINEGMITSRMINDVLCGDEPVMREEVRSYAADSANFIGTDSLPEPTRIEAALRQMEI